MKNRGEEVRFLFWEVKGGGGGGESYADGIILAVIREILCFCNARCLRVRELAFDGLGLLRINEWESQFAYECRLRLLAMPMSWRRWGFLWRTWNGPSFLIINSLIDSTCETRYLVHSKDGFIKIEISPAVRLNLRDEESL
ncbi:hypothetical protein CEXT_79211 [Caerostris extrusa]|uniref:Uncharacterized protein n=1 Tax=Caerostris extrusa TaxID=172846 RepID=A0AAV4WBD8_CAEEX|nr:hypothetical protein CEXT_79211 [Caerostris extrusa]